MPKIFGWLCSAIGFSNKSLLDTRGTRLVPICCRHSGAQERWQALALHHQLWHISQLRSSYVLCSKYKPTITPYLCFRGLRITHRVFWKGLLFAIALLLRHLAREAAVVAGREVLTLQLPLAGSVSSRTFCTINPSIWVGSLLPFLFTSTWGSRLSRLEDERGFGPKDQSVKRSLVLSPLLLVMNPMSWGTACRQCACVWWPPRAISTPEGNRAAI